MQLELFRGAHLPIMRCLAALEAGDLREARAALDPAMSDRGVARDRDRLAALESRLSANSPGAPPPEAVHAAFEAAVPPGDAGAIPADSWFRLYARHLAAALEVEAGRRFRGWCALHFLLAASRSDAALRSAPRLLSGCGQAWAWLEAARAAAAAGDLDRARRWVLVACLRAEEALEPAPPALAHSGVVGLDPPPGVLPRLPPAIEALWEAVEGLDLPGPASAWVPAVGITDGVFAPPLLGWSIELADAGFDPVGATPAEEPAPRAFVRALLAARRARAAMPPSPPAGCGPAELAARLDMKRLAPRLLVRYLARLGGERASR